MRRLFSTAVFIVCATTGTIGQAARPAIFITPTGDGFDLFVAAALARKNVPATVVTSPDGAQLTLKTTPVEVQKESARMKVVKCLMQSCANTEDKASASAQLLDRKGIVLWSYATGDDDSSKKAIAESIAKHLKKEYFRQ